MIKNKLNTVVWCFFVVTATLLVTVRAAGYTASEATTKEYQIKAAFIYNFIQFVDWPVDQNSDPNAPITIGVIGKNPFGDTLDSIKDKKILNRPIKIEYLPEFKKIKDLAVLKNCQVLFICSSEKEDIKQIIDVIKNNSILTIAETEEFLESGGIVRFIVEEAKIRFEINVTAAERANLKIRSKLLRLAKSVYKEDKASERTNAGQEDGIVKLVSISEGIKE